MNFSQYPKKLKSILEFTPLSLSFTLFVATLHLSHDTGKLV